MTKQTLEVFALIVLLMGIVVYHMPVNNPTAVEAAPMQTRGMAEEHNADWELLLQRLRQEENVTVLTGLGMMMVSQIQIDGTIPLWGVIVVIGSVICTAIGIVIKVLNRLDRVSEKLDEHCKSDAERFESVAEQIAESHKELRLDIRAIRPNR